MSYNEKMNTLKGIVTITNETTGETVTKENVVVDAGWQQMFYLLFGANTNHFEYMAIGDDDTTASSTDSSLGNEREQRIQIDSLTYDTQYVEANIVVQSDDHLYTWKELGIFNNQSGGTMFARINVDYTHASGDQININWRWERT